MGLMPRYLERVIIETNFNGMNMRLLKVAKDITPFFFLSVVFAPD